MLQNIDIKKLALNTNISQSGWGVANFPLCLQMKSFKKMVEDLIIFLCSYKTMCEVVLVGLILGLPLNLI